MSTHDQSHRVVICIALMLLTFPLLKCNQLCVLIIPSILRLLTSSVPVALPPLVIRLCFPAKPNSIELLNPLVVKRNIVAFALLLELEALVVYPKTKMTDLRYFSEINSQRKIHKTYQLANALFSLNSFGTKQLL